METDKNERKLTAESDKETNRETKRAESRFSIIWQGKNCGFHFKIRSSKFDICLMTNYKNMFIYSVSTQTKINLLHSHTPTPHVSSNPHRVNNWPVCSHRAERSRAASSHWTAQKSAQSRSSWYNCLERRAMRSTQQPLAPRWWGSDRDKWISLVESQTRINRSTEVRHKDGG